MTRLLGVDYVRGSAAFLVLFFHATNTVNNYPTAEWLRVSGSVGHFGVEAFFVISGFIIPYSMERAGYRLKNIASFFTKRLIRVEPAYFLSIIFSILTGVLVNFYYQKELYVYTPEQVFSHLFYLTNFLGYEWINPVYWTLAIEFQFYILISLFYPIIFNSRLRFIAFLLVLLFSFVEIKYFQGTAIQFLPFLL